MQDSTLVVTGAPSWLDTIGPVLTALLPFVQGRLSVPLFEIIKRLSAWVSSRVSWQKQVLVFLLNGAIAALGAVLHVELPGLDAWTTATINAVLGAAVGLAAHAGASAREAREETRALQRMLTAHGTSAVPPSPDA